MEENRNRRAAARRRRRRNAFILRMAVLALAAVLVILVVVALFGGKNNGGMQNQPTQTDEPVQTDPPDTTPPVLMGVKDLILYQGDTVSYYAGVSATDDTDPAPVITLDNSKVDLSALGDYEVTYTATDAAGNSTSMTVKVSVCEKPKVIVPEETIYAAVDAKLAKIIRKNATVEQQVQDIYRWARTNLGYSGHSVRSDYMQAGYTMLTEGMGDCYGYYAVTKLMFERLGIPNIDVKKVKNYPEDSNHFWSLVSVDGGNTWYHFDATPRKGEGDDFCLVTDAFLDAYSKTHNNCHNRDKSLYPATP